MAFNPEQSSVFSQGGRLVRLRLQAFSCLAFFAPLSGSLLRSAPKTGQKSTKQFKRLSISAGARKGFLLFLLLLGSFSAFSQSALKIDSLQKLIAKQAADTHQVSLFNKLAYEYINRSPDSTLLFANKALELAQNLNYDLGMAVAHNGRADYLVVIGEYDSAISEYTTALHVLERLQKPLVKANTLSDLAIAHFYKGDYTAAVDNHLKALAIFESKSNQKGIASTFQNIGAVYFRMEDFPNAKIYFNDCLKIANTLNDSSIISNALINLGNVAFYEGDYETTITNFEHCAGIYLRAGDDLGASQTYNNLAVVCAQLGEYDKAENYVMQALAIKKRLKDQKGLAAAWSNISAIHSMQNNHDEALAAGDSSMYYAQNGGGLDAVMVGAKILEEVYAARKEYEQAFFYAKLYSQTKDSLFAENSATQIEALKSKYEDEKKERELMRLAQEQASSEVTKLESEAHIAEKGAAEHSANVQESIFYVVIVCGAFGLLLVVIIFFRKIKRSKQLKAKQAEIQQQTQALQKGNQEISQQKQQIDLQNTALKKAHEEILLTHDILEERNKDMMSSIRYAERIQMSMLPSRKQIKRLLTASFVFFQPKELVSGDFYWADEANGKVIFSAIDCTGHGVPGAFVSMVGNSALNRSVKEMGIHKPSEVLESLANYFEDIFAIKAAQTESTTIKDGMDMALCTLDRQTNQLEYCGAYNSLYLVRHKDKPAPGFPLKNETETHALYELRADRQPVGRFAHREAFTNHQIQLQTGDIIYLYSDGFADQFGGSKGKKYMYSNFRKFLLAVQHLSMEEQRAALQTEFNEWKGTLEQVDDAVIMGVRV